MRRILMAVCVACLAVAISPTHAFAWQNGDTRDGFGTHDWILYKAMELAGADADWVDETEALLATDDPDNWRDDNPSNSLEYRAELQRHVFYAGSANQGAPHAVAEHYSLMLQALSAKDPKTASRELGYLSHYYSDILVPFHTFNYGIGSNEEGQDHVNYESAVEAVTRTPDSHSDWITPLAPRPVTDVRARTIEAATFSAGKMLGLITEYGSFAYYDPESDPQTQLLLNRAANDLADVIRAAKTRTGQPRPIAQIVTWTDYEYPALGRSTRVGAKVTDDRGHVVRGVQVDFDFRVAQPSSYRRYTEADGIARQTHGVVVGALDVPFDVVVTATSAGTTLTRTVRLTPKEIIGKGSLGIRTYTKYDSTPAQGTTVTVLTHVQDDSGQPIRNIKVVFTFKHKTRWVKSTVYTNSSGNAWLKRNIGSSTAGYRVYVRADAYGGTEPQNTYDGIRTSTSSFVPRSSVASLRTYLLTRPTPSQSTTVTVKARCLDDHGAPIVGRLVKFGWKFKSGTSYTYARTNTNGNAYTVRNIGKSTSGYKVYVTAYVSSGGKVKKSAVSFTPMPPLQVIR
ncbi:MAG: hypothetical protein CVT67_10870 [Actinobacteria bacterium HGW-Actinobacteria-7]|jgi:hypothetical protein|nr:MAG: hypothetical protein CVT67_10870 [Actinobacteria bacterium HGW-Actinobacteria-7]